MSMTAAQRFADDMVSDERESLAMRRVHAQNHLSIWRKSVTAGIIVANAYFEASCALRGAEGAERAARLVEAGSVVTEVATSNDLTTIAFEDQGKVSVNCEDSWTRRLALRFSPLVRDVLEAFWKAALASEYLEMRLADPSASTARPTSIGFTNYAHLFRRVYITLIEDFDTEECEASIEEDWASDCAPGGGEVMERDAYQDALFELADLWTEGIDAGEYAQFLWELYRGVTEPYERRGTESGGGGHVWRGLDRVHYENSYHHRHHHHYRHKQPKHQQPWIATSMVSALLAFGLGGSKERSADEATTSDAFDYNSLDWGHVTSRVDTGQRRRPREASAKRAPIVARAHKTYAPIALRGRQHIDEYWESIDSNLRLPRGHTGRPIHGCPRSARILSYLVRHDALLTLQKCAAAWLARRRFKRLLHAHRAHELQSYLGVPSTYHLRAARIEAARTPARGAARSVPPSAARPWASSVGFDLGLIALEGSRMPEPPPPRYHRARAPAKRAAKSKGSEQTWHTPLALRSDFALTPLSFQPLRRRFQLPHAFAMATMPNKPKGTALPETSRLGSLQGLQAELCASRSSPTLALDGKIDRTAGEDPGSYSALPSRPTSALPSRPTSALPSRPTSALPSRPTSVLPSRPTSALPSRPTSALSRAASAAALGRTHSASSTALHTPVSAPQPHVLQMRSEIATRPRSASRAPVYHLGQPGMSRAIDGVVRDSIVQ